MSIIKKILSKFKKLEQVKDEITAFPSHVKLRTYLKLPNEQFRKFYWFELKGDDFYWGKSQQSGVYSKEVDSNSEDGIKIKILDNIDDMPTLQVKESYHSSGDVHIKTQSGNEKPTYISISKWAKKSQLEKPIRLETTFTAIIETYNQFVDKPKAKESKHEYSMIIELDEDSLSRRLYLELYLAPEGKYNFLDSGPRFFSDENLQDFTFKMSDKLIFICRFNINDELQGLKPNCSFSMYIDKYSRNGY